MGHVLEDLPSFVEASCRNEIARGLWKEDENNDENESYFYIINEKPSSPVLKIFEAKSNENISKAINSIDHQRELASIFRRHEFHKDHVGDMGSHRNSEPK